MNLIGQDRESGIKLCLHSTLHENKKLSVDYINWEGSVEIGEDYVLVCDHNPSYYPAIIFTHLTHTIRFFLFLISCVF